LNKPQIFAVLAFFLLNVDTAVGTGFSADSRSCPYWKTQLLQTRVYMPAHIWFGWMEWGTINIFYSNLIAFA